MQHAGYRILQASNSSEALTVFEAHRDVITLLISDMEMPEGPEGDVNLKRNAGITLASAIASKPGGTKVIFMMGGAADQDILEAAKEYGPVLPKPIQTFALLDEVKKLAGGAHVGTPAEDRTSSGV